MHWAAIMNQSEEIRLYIADLINQENEQYSNLVQSLRSVADLDPTKRLLEIISFAHKAKIDLLEKIFKNLND